ncbi:MAG: helix-turn-helix domain-containing protein [Rhizobium sp.]|nr:helix-turn-helix domain-containing protein [Rhizobium sp.]
MKRYNDLLFDQDMTCAQRHGELIRFTKNERLLLKAFTQKAGRLLSRDSLLDAISGTGSDRSDRNIDYVITRLRAKIGDSVKKPCFLATRYGEGYIWIAQPEEAELSDAFLVVGPVYGLEGEAFEPEVREVIHHLCDLLSERLAEPRKVVFSSAFDPRQQARGVEYCLEMSFLKDGAKLHARAVLRSARSWQTVKVLKLVINWLAGHGDPGITALATEVIDEMVFHASETGTQASAIPLELSMHEASRIIGMPDQGWLDSGEMLARKRAEDPADAKVAVMWASHLYAVLILGPPNFGLNDERREQIEREIEATCLACLPDVQNNPVLRACIAKLLFFVDRRHLDLSESLLREILESPDLELSVVYPLLGQMRALRGEFDDALRYFDHALLTAEAGSQYHIYISVLRLSMFLASGQREQLEREAEALYRLSPQTLYTVGIFLGGPDDPLRPEHDAVLTARGPDGALDMLKYLYNTSARQFVSPVHRERVYAGFAAQVERKFGLRFVPPERVDA